MVNFDQGAHVTLRVIRLSIKIQLFCDMTQVKFVRTRRRVPEQFYQMSQSVLCRFKHWAMSGLCHYVLDVVKSQTL